MSGYTCGLYVVHTACSSPGAWAQLRLTNACSTRIEICGKSGIMRIGSYRSSTLHSWTEQVNKNPTNIKRRHIIGIVDKIYRDAM